MARRGAPVHVPAAALGFGFALPHLRFWRVALSLDSAVPRVNYDRDV